MSGAIPVLPLYAFISITALPIWVVIYRVSLYHILYYVPNIITYVRFEVSLTVSGNITVPQDVIPCGLVNIYTYACVKKCSVLRDG